MNQTEILELHNIIKFVQEYYNDYSDLLSILDSENAALNVICLNADKCNVINFPFLVTAFDIWDNIINKEQPHSKVFAINNIINDYVEFILKHNIEI